MEIVKIGIDEQDQRGVRLSTFFPRSFVLDGVWCASIESFLQAIKLIDEGMQVSICKKTAGQARRNKPLFDKKCYRAPFEVYWKGRTYRRHSGEYQALITRMYDALFEQDPTIKDHLKAAEGYVLEDTSANHDSHRTVLTSAEAMWQLNRLVLRSVYQ